MDRNAVDQLIARRNEIGNRAFITEAADGVHGDEVAQAADYLLTAAIELDWINSDHHWTVHERVAEGIFLELLPEPELVPHAW